MAERVLRECELSAPVQLWLEARGYQVWVEIPFPSRASVIDIVGQKDNDLIIVELKMSLTKKVIYQAHIAKLITPHTYCAVSSWPKQSGLDVAQKLGIGVLSVLKNAEVKELLIPSKLHEPLEHYRNRVLEYLKVWESGGVAGRPQMKGEGPAQDCLKRVREYRLQNPKTTWKEIYANVYNHYSSVASMQNSMRKVYIATVKARG